MNDAILENDSFPNVCAKARNGHETTHAFSVKFGGCLITIKSNSAELNARLKDYLSPFLAEGRAPDMEIIAIDAPPPRIAFPLNVKTPDPGKTKIKEEYHDFQGGRLVLKRITGMVFIFGGGTHIGIGPALKEYNQVINFINSRYIQWELDKGGLLMHAAGVSIGGTGLALSGFSGRGKSTLALSMMSMGADFVSNDRLIVNESEGALRMNGVAKLPRVNPGTLINNPDIASILSPVDRREYEKMDQSALWNLERKHDVLIEECFGAGKFALSAEMRGLVVLNWDMNTKAPPRITRSEISENRRLLGAFMKSVGLFYESGPYTAEQDFSEEAYIELLSSCPVYEITGGVNFPFAAKELMGMMESSGGDKQPLRPGFSRTLL